jgi:cysteine desulfurase/selenocysteine lyase
MTKLAPRLNLPALDPYDIKRDFPIFDEPVNGKKLVFLDTAASAQKPRAVIDAMANMMAHDYANIHRGVYALSQRATEAFENARAKVARFIGAPAVEEIVFTRNATEAINLVAATWGAENLHEGDEVLLTELEHHANIVPWQLLQQKSRFTIKVAPINDDGSLDLDRFAALLSDRTKLVSVSHMSNALGSILPAAEIVRLAKRVGARVLLDGCQAVTHLPVDVASIGCDFYVFSGHKLYGPTGIGVLWGRKELLDAMPPYQGGGDMIERVSWEGTSFKPTPQRFEAGTPAIVEAVGLGAAIDYVGALGMDAIAAHEHELLVYARGKIGALPFVKLVGTAEEAAGVLAFTLDAAHPHDVATILDKKGIAVRAGHHCAQPLMQRLGVAATTRASFGIYSTREDVDALEAGLHTVQSLFG